MDLFHNAKVIRLRSHHDKYLTAPEEEEEESVVTQDLNGISKGARWTVEYLDNDNSVNIRLRSCNGKYLTASDQPFLLGMTGRKVLQTLPPRLNSSVEWEPIREGNRVKLRTSYGSGTFLQGNSGVPPWRNSVTNDIPNCTASQDWILWEVDVVEIVVHSATCEKDKGNILHNPEHLTTLPLAPPEQLCRPFSLTEILSATNNFDESLVIGQGGFGKVYKGVIENGTSVVAIKRLNSTSKQGVTEFRTEIEMLSKFRHSHIVSLIGYCYSSIEMIIIYKYMVNGSLADHLYRIGECGSCSPLSWVQRLKICLGAARGLDYLHTSTGVQGSVIHRDVKSSNILLDKNYEAKVSDFGLSRISPIDQSCTYISTNVKGTMGYMDPEYFLTLRLTMKSDVYSFGVVMFEALCGRRAVDLTLDEEQWSLARWAQYCIDKGTLHRIIDPNLRWEILPESLKEFARIANQCLCYCSKKRPTMTQVMGSLELALALQLGHKDSSTFEMEIFCTSEADENLEKVNSTMVQDEAFKFASCNEDSKDILQSHVNPTKRKALTNMLRRFTFCTVQEASEKDIPPHFLDEEMFLKEKRNSGSRLQSSRTDGRDLTQGGSDFEEKVAMLVGLGFRRVAVILALKFFHGNEEQAALYLFGRSI